MDNEFLSKSTAFFCGVATPSAKFELMQPEQGELQHQANESVIAGFSFW